MNQALVQKVINYAAELNKEITIVLLSLSTELTKQRK